MNRRQALTKAIQALASVPVLGWMGERKSKYWRVTCQYDNMGRCVKQWAVPSNSDAYMASLKAGMMTRNEVLRFEQLSGGAV